ncbi:MAG: SDR family oxidoreductase [Woeseiaceae bacterium]|jgi:3-oxoacyl-[acyl-carrier protein] reductase|nr:SDR family oxidoreductase [Woeseiaceae bacterium]MDG1712737.1 SDR family NAD(P)-dependent oxidoreductase [Woeseiaceae bacterium]
MYQFKKKIVLITGGSRGIGKAIAESFALHGAHVVITYKKEKDKAEELIASLPGKKHICIQSDVTIDGEAKAVITKVICKFGALDIVINNAGMYINHPIAKIAFKEWQAAWSTTLETNLIGPANICYYAAKYMMSVKRGKIINISSRGANRGEPNAPAYGASKAGINAMSQSLAIALAPHNVFVGVVAPGFVETDMAASSLKGKQGQAIKNQSPMQRVGKPEEIAKAVLMLSVDGMDYATGAIIDLNGASYLRS